MNISKKVHLGLLLLAAATSAQAWFDDEIDRYFKEQRKQLKEMRKQMKSLSQLPRSSSNIAIQEEDNMVLVTITGIDAQELEATLNDNNDRLSIITPDQQITIAVKGNMIGIETAQEKKEVRKKKGDKKDRISTQYIGGSYSSMSQTVGAPLLLEKQTIDYDQEKQELIIRIPKQEIKKGKSVPINKIGTPKKIVVEQEPQSTLTEEK